MAKPYDAEAATLDVATVAKEEIQRAIDRIVRARDSAIERLRVESSTFLGLPEDLTTLLAKAALVRVHELDGTVFQTPIGEPKIRVDYGIRFNGSVMIQPPDRACFVPAQKYRALLILVPME